MRERSLLFQALHFAVLSVVLVTGCVSPLPPSAPKLSIATASLPGGAVGSAYSASVSLKGGTAPYSYSATGLPAALSIATASGVIAGTPAQSAIGTAAVALTVTDSSSPQQTATAKLNLTIDAAKLTVITNSLANAIVGSPYSGVIGASGGVTPYKFNASGLPSGLSINASTGAITGTPGTVGTANATFTVTDSATSPQTATAKISLSVLPGALLVTSTSLPAGTVGVAYSAHLAVSGGLTPYSFIASGLPAGLAINASTGAITGTPTQAAAGTSQVTFTVKDSSAPQQTATAKINITISAATQNKLAVTTSSLPNGTAGTAYSATIGASGGTTPYAFSASGLPASLAINDSNGAITGTPAAGDIGTVAVVIAVTDSSAPQQTATANLELTIDAASSASACGKMSLGDNASLNGFVPFPADNAWNTDISNAPLDPNNTAITTAAGFAGLHLHHDWSSVAGGNYGIPYVVVDSGTTTLVPIDVIDYASESDVAMAPYPLTAPIEGAPADCDGWPDTYVGDSHVLVLDRKACMLYETFNTHRCSGQWSSSSETIWDLQSYDGRPWGWTSADAAGLPIFPGLVRYDEVAGGAINHAIRFTMAHTKNDANGGYFVEPASHAAGTDWGVYNVMGMRIRLKAGFDISGFSKANQVILTAMKKYGMILADNGSYFYFQGVPDPRWDDNDLVNLDAIGSENFEVVQMTPTYPGYDSATAPTGNPPTINSFTSSAMTVTSGTAVTLTWSTTNDSYDFIDKLGGVHGGSVTITPTATTTYILNATNQFGRSTATVTVTVQ